MGVIKTIKKRIKAREAEIYNTLIGSIVLTVGILNQKSKEEMLKYYDNLKKHSNVLPDTVAEITDYVWAAFANNENLDLKEKIVLLYDDNEIYPPKVSYVVSSANEEGVEYFMVMPLREDGVQTGIIKAANDGKEGIGVEYVFIGDEVNE